MDITQRTRVRCQGNVLQCAFCCTCQLDLSQYQTCTMCQDPASSRRSELPCLYAADPGTVPRLRVSARRSQSLHRVQLAQVVLLRRSDINIPAGAAAGTQIA